MSDDATTQQRLALLSAVAASLSSASSREAVLRTLLQDLVGELCDGSEVALVDGHGVLRRIVQSNAPSGDWRIREDVPVPDVEGHPVWQVYRTGATRTVDSTKPEDRPLLGPAEDPASVWSLGIRNAVITPLHARESVLGVLSVGAGSRHGPFDAEGVKLVEAVARLASLAIENLNALTLAREAKQQIQELFEEQRTIADTLQRNLLPASLPEIPGVNLTAHYWPSTDDLEVGGDFYDVFEVTDGLYGVMIGDVCGKGIKAAALTAAARHTARSAALHLDDPGLVLKWVHDSIRAEGRDTFCTMAMGLLDLRGELAELRLSLGGHPKPILVTGPGAVAQIGEYGSLIGMLESPRFHTTSHRLVSGDLVAFYTDGFTDAPRRGGLTADELGEGLAALRGRGLAEASRHLREQLEERSGGDVNDDVALVMIELR